MFSDDSFFTLSPAQAAGLVAVSASMAFLLMGLVYKAGRKFGSVIALVCATVCFVSFQWLSPQIYYFYYRAIFEDLPNQIVILPFPDLGNIAPTLVFRAPASLASVSQGLLGWALLACALLSGRMDLASERKKHE